MSIQYQLLPFLFFMIDYDNQNTKLQIISHVNLFFKLQNMQQIINIKNRHSLIICFLLIVSNSQLLNVDIFNVFGLSKHESVIQKSYNVSNFVLNRIRGSNESQTLSDQAAQQIKEQIQQKCSSLTGSYTITINKTDIVLNITNYGVKQWSYARKKSRIPFFSLLQIFSQRDLELPLTQYIRRQVALGTKYDFQFKLSNNCILKDSIEQNYFVGTLISLLYAIANLVILPPFRKYLSVVSRRSPVLSLAINLQIQTIAFLVILSHLIISSVIAFQLNFNNLLSITIIVAVLFMLFGYWIGMSYSLMKKMQRIQSLRNLHNFLLLILVAEIGMVVPVAFLILSKGVHFHFFGLIPLYLQLFWLIKAKAGIPLRYLSFCCVSNWFLILMAKFYPILSFQQLSAMEVYLLGLLYAFSLGILVFADCCCKKEGYYDQSRNTLEDQVDNIESPSKSQELAQVSETGISKQSM